MSRGQRKYCLDVSWNVKKNGKKETVSLKQDPYNETKEYTFFFGISRRQSMFRPRKSQSTPNSNVKCALIHSKQEVVIPKCCDRIQANFDNKEKVTAIHRRCVSQDASVKGQIKLRCISCGSGLLPLPN